MTTLNSGFAAAALPVNAQTITTNSEGLTAGVVQISVRDGQMPAYRASPAGGKAMPVVLVVQEIFGVHEHIRDVCRRLAKVGYLAVAPELYARQGDAGIYPDVDTLVKEVVSRVPDEQVMSDLDATAAWAAENGGNADKMAVTGFCWGGRIVWMYAAHNRRLKAGAAWYGGLVGEGSLMTPKHPIDIAPTLTVPVLGLYGGADTGIALDTVEKMRNALKKAGSAAEIVVYVDAPHGFHADYRPSYRAESAGDAWQRMLMWFQKYGAA